MAIRYDANGLPIGTPRKSFTVGGYTPDYSNLIQNDPLYMQQQKDLSAQGIADHSRVQSKIDQGLIGLGMNVPGANVDPTTQALIDANNKAGLSTQAQLERAHNQDLQSLRGNLASRGMLESGETGYQLQQTDQNYALQQQQARQNFLNYMSGMNDSLASNDAQRQRDLASGLQDAATRQGQINPYLPGVNVDAAFNPLVHAWKGSDGNVYDNNNKQLDPRNLRQDSRQRVIAMRNAGMSWRQINKSKPGQNWLQVNQALGLDAAN